MDRRTVGTPLSAILAGLTGGSSVVAAGGDGGGAGARRKRPRGEDGGGGGAGAGAKRGRGDGPRASPGSREAGDAGRHAAGGGGGDDGGAMATDDDAGHAGGSGGGSGGHGAAPPAAAAAPAPAAPAPALDPCAVFVKSIPFSLTSSEELQAALAAALPGVTLARVGVKDGRGQGFGYARFVDEAHAAAAIATGSVPLGGRKVALLPCQADFVAKWAAPPKRPVVVTAATVTSFKPRVVATARGAKAGAPTGGAAGHA
jgi:hypothetical protein